MNLPNKHPAHQPGSGISPERLSSYADGEQSPRQAQEIEEQLSQDEALRREMHAIAALDQLLEQWPEPALTADLCPPVMARVQRDLERGGWGRLWLSQWGRPAWAAAWVFGGMLAGLALWSNMDSHATERLAAEKTAQEMMVSMSFAYDLGEDNPLLPDPSAGIAPEETRP